MEKVVEAHPAAHYVVTSRPDNVDYARFAAHGFQQLGLLETTPDEAQECVRRWFKALISARITRGPDQVRRAARPPAG